MTWIQNRVKGTIDTGTLKSLCNTWKRVGTKITKDSSMETWGRLNSVKLKNTISIYQILQIQRLIETVLLLWICLFLRTDTAGEWQFSVARQQREPQFCQSKGWKAFLFQSLFLLDCVLNMLLTIVISNILHHPATALSKVERAQHFPVNHIDPSECYKSSFVISKQQACCKWIFKYFFCLPL